jgi:chaperonin cofactor prefoldin
VALEAKVEKLEAKIQTMSSSEKELRQELDALLRSEKTNENSVSLNTTKM